MHGMAVVAVSGVGVVRGLMVIAFFVMLRGFTMMLCRMFVMFRGFHVMVRRMLRHNALLSREFENRRHEDAYVPAIHLRRILIM